MSRLSVLSAAFLLAAGTPLVATNASAQISGNSAREKLNAGRSAWWYPYVVGGLGGKTYDFDRLDAKTDFAGNFGGGIEFRFNRNWGIQAEARDFVSSFDRLGIDSTQHDIVYTGGISLSF